MKRNIKDKKITFKIDSERFDLLHDYSDREGISTSALIRHLIIRYLENAKRYDLNRIMTSAQEQR